MEMTSRNEKKVSLKTKEKRKSPFLYGFLVSKEGVEMESMDKQKVNQQTGDEIKNQVAKREKTIIGYATAGASIMIFLNLITSGAVPGGFTGGALGAFIGMTIGAILNPQKK